MDQERISAEELLSGEIGDEEINREKEKDISRETPRVCKRLGWFLKSVPLICGVFAVVFSLFTNGAEGRIYEVYIFDEYEYVCIRLISFIFGGGDIYSPDNKKLDELYFGSGISLFGVVSFICLIVAVVLFIVFIGKKKDGCYVASCVSFILSGIAILFLLTNGTTLSGRSGWSGWRFEDIRSDFRLGVGVIVWCLLCVLGGAFGLIYHFAMKARGKTK